MRDQLIIHLSEQAPEQVSWVRLSDSNPDPLIGHGSLNEAADVSLGAQVVVMVPGSDILLGTASVPTKNKQRLLKAIPYAMEEELASDVDQLHFALAEPETDGQVNVAVVDRHFMDRWQEMLKAAALNTDLLVSEQMVVPLMENSWTLILDGRHALVKCVKHQGFVAEVENLGVIMPLLLKEQGAALPENIYIWRDAANQGITPLLPEEIHVNHEQLNSGLLGLITEKKLDVGQCINLLQGDYSRREQLGKLWRPWRYVAALAGLLFVLQMVIAITESSRLETQYLGLKSEARSIFKETFPKIKRIVNVKAQMKQELSKLKGKGSTKKVNFLNLLADSGSAFKQTSGLVLRSVRYKNSALDVELEVPSLQVLDQLKQKLSKKKGLTVEIQSAASRNNIVQGRLQIKGSAS